MISICFLKYWEKTKCSEIKSVIFYRENNVGKMFSFAGTFLLLLIWQLDLIEAKQSFDREPEHTEVNPEPRTPAVTG